MYRVYRGLERWNVRTNDSERLLLFLFEQECQG